MMRFAHITGKTMGGIDCCFTKIDIASTSSGISQKDFLLKKKDGVNDKEESRQTLFFLLNLEKEMFLTCMSYKNF